MCTVVRRNFTPSCDRRDSPLALVLAFVVGILGCGSSGSGPSNAELVAQGKQTFRYDTFGDETKWTDTLRMNEAISTVDPTTALTVGLKVDSEALPPAVVTGIQNGSSSPMTRSRTVDASRPISSAASRSAVAAMFASPGSAAPPGNEISPE